MDEIIKFNRTTLNSVEKWIEKEDWDIPNSIFNYGLPSHIRHLIDLPISNDLTEADLLCSYISEMLLISGYVRYIEIGVSVGKTFYQIANYSKHVLPELSDIKISCLDIEKINPNLEKLLDKMHNNKNTIYIPSSKLKNSMRNKLTNSITNWNNITYYESDEFDPSIWKYMNTKYNVIFSDALHDPSALLCEYEQIKENNLFDERGFIYCFDDLESTKYGKMWLAVISIFDNLVITFPNLKITLEHRIVNGWIGQHEFPHNFGIIKAMPL